MGEHEEEREWDDEQPCTSAMGEEEQPCTSAIGYASSFSSRGSITSTHSYGSRGLFNEAQQEAFDNALSCLSPNENIERRTIKKGR